MEHTFDISLAKNDRKVVIDVLTSDTPIPQVEIIKEYVKMFDIKVNLYILAIPKLDVDARKLADSYRVKFVESFSPKEAADNLVKLLESGYVDSGRLSQ